MNGLNLKAIQEQLANTVCKAVEQAPGAWDCRVYMLSEPKMPVELILEDAE